MIVSAYFVPNEDTVEHLIQAVERGVDVQVMMPGRHADERILQLAGEDTFRPPIEAGVKLWKYELTSCGRISEDDNENLVQRINQFM